MNIFKKRKIFYSNYKERGYITLVSLPHNNKRKCLLFASLKTR